MMHLDKSNFSLIQHVVKSVVHVTISKKKKKKLFILYTSYNKWCGNFLIKLSIKVEVKKTLPEDW
jgi:hypothetical protein